MTKSILELPSPAFATPDDLPAVLALVQSAYRGTTARRGWTHEADLIAGQRTDLTTLAAILADSRQRLLILRDGGSIIGSVVIEDKGAVAGAPGDARTAYLGMLSVDPRRQAAGLGRVLIRAAEHVARQDLAATRMEMTVIGQRAELIAYYQRRGYQLTGETRAFPYGDASVGTPLIDTLHFVVLAKILVAA